MSLYGRFFAAVYDRSVAQSEELGMRDRRRSLLADTRGRVLEIGAGTGLNLPLYPPSVEHLTVTEPEEPMLRRLRERAATLDRSVEMVRAPAERLPLPAHAFDFVVSTAALCTVDDLDASLAEIRRVLAADGRLLLIEHVRSDDPKVARWQDRLHGPWRVLAHGCHDNLDTAAHLAAAGFDVGQLRIEEWAGGPVLARRLLVGAALIARPDRPEPAAPIGR